MTAEDTNKQVVKRWLEEGWNKKDAKIFFESLADDFFNHCTGRDLKKMKTDLQVVFEKPQPTSRVEIEEMIAEGNQVALRLTHLDEGSEPRLELVICRLHDGKITDVWNGFGAIHSPEKR